MRCPNRLHALPKSSIAAGVLTGPQLDLALLEQKRNGQQLGQVLVQLGFVRPEVMAEYLAREAETRPINLNSVAIDQAALRLVPMELAKRFRLMPVWHAERSLTVAMANPFDVVAIDTLHQFTGMSIDVVTAPERDILNCQELYYAAGDSIGDSSTRFSRKRLTNGRVRWRKS